MTASFNGYVDIVRMLIKAKAKVNTQNEVATILLLPENNTVKQITIHRVAV